MRQKSILAEGGSRSSERVSRNDAKNDGPSLEMLLKRIVYDFRIRVVSIRSLATAGGIPTQQKYGKLVAGAVYDFACALEGVADAWLNQTTQFWVFQHSSNDAAVPAAKLKHKFSDSEAEERIVRGVLQRMNETIKKDLAKLLKDSNEKAITITKREVDTATALTLKTFASDLAEKTNSNKSQQENKTIISADQKQTDASGSKSAATKRKAVKGRKVPVKFNFNEVDRRNDLDTSTIDLVSSNESNLSLRSEDQATGKCIDLTSSSGDNSGSSGGNSVSHVTESGPDAVHQLSRAASMSFDWGLLFGTTESDDESGEDAPEDMTISLTSALSIQTKESSTIFDRAAHMVSASKESITQSEVLENVSLLNPQQDETASLNPTSDEGGGLSPKQEVYLLPNPSSPNQTAADTRMSPTHTPIQVSQVEGNSEVDNRESNSRLDPMNVSTGATLEIADRSDDQGTQANREEKEEVNGSTVDMLVEALPKALLQMLEETASIEAGVKSGRQDSPKNQAQSPKSDKLSKFDNNKAYALATGVVAAAGTAISMVATQEGHPSTQEVPAEKKEEVAAVAEEEQERREDNLLYYDNWFMDAFACKWFGFNRSSPDNGAAGITVDNINEEKIPANERGQAKYGEMRKAQSSSQTHGYSTNLVRPFGEFGEGSKHNQLYIPGSILGESLQQKWEDKIDLGLIFESKKEDRNDGAGLQEQYRKLNPNSKYKDIEVLGDGSTEDKVMLIADSTTSSNLAPPKKALAVAATAAVVTAGGGSLLARENSKKKKWRTPKLSASRSMSKSVAESEKKSADVSRFTKSNKLQSLKGAQRRKSSSKSVPMSETAQRREVQQREGDTGMEPATSILRNPVTVKNNAEETALDPSTNVEKKNVAKGAAAVAGVGLMAKFARRPSFFKKTKKDKSSKSVQSTSTFDPPEVDDENANANPPQNKSILSVNASGRPDTKARVGNKLDSPIHSVSVTDQSPRNTMPTAVLSPKYSNASATKPSGNMSRTELQKRSATEASKGSKYSALLADEKSAEESVADHSVEDSIMEFLLDDTMSPPGI
jgi:hypothetical protein